MISFEEICSLKDIRDAVAEKHKLTVGDPSIKIVSFQSEFILFCCLIEGTTDGAIHTIFGKFNIFDKTAEDIYTHPDPIDVLVASLNQDANLLSKGLPNRNHFNLAHLFGVL